MHPPSAQGNDADKGFTPGAGLLISAAFEPCGARIDCNRQQSMAGHQEHGAPPLWSWRLRRTRNLAHIVRRRHR